MSGTYSNEKWKTQTVEAYSKVFWLRSKLRQYIVEEFGLQFQYVTQFRVIV